MSTPPPNYYAILEVPEDASLDRIREAYKRAALKTHPDRVPEGSPDRAERTRRFQLVNDAYYTLSDPTRRREYDAQRKMFNRAPSSDPFAEADEDAPPGYSAGGGGAGAGHDNPYSWAWNFFTKGNGGGGQRERTENDQFRDVFEEMMREQGMAEDDGTNRPTNKFWSIVGGLSGGALGFIVANVPGMVAGAVAGNRLGAVRDARGKSVFAVFQELPQDDRTRLLSQLAAKVFSHATGI
ncbi:hypothetical protein V2A60_000111 [Cordyceps javanica]|uniref:DnaJ chaperone (Caj1) n=1 Tax=Cordyceps javanica TaxID=43265 RepID=A0A545W3K9_9HYPO|nr:DnaJ chaperone (Caj1) [Cordyceps javanica]TQW08510.1 DnaJ chaperone (Caj1) [Cordyceps javanica]